MAAAIAALALSIVARSGARVAACARAASAFCGSIEACINAVDASRRACAAVTTASRDAPTSLTLVSSGALLVCLASAASVFNAMPRMPRSSTLPVRR